ncbi:hypothetical protein DPMN_070103 [Dreissena polymorpha]|uniref:Uricase n=1 Tax=Dreissena polymorpha TaxID=45954 RepID=A0A9D4BVE9_DREPO|nr:hypothetical protein DPMN_070103 [Dreissena polymorpha]
MNVKLLFVRKGQSKHLIKQLKTTTVDIREKKHEKTNVVTFALISSNRFLSKYGNVVDAKISVLEYQWKRVQIDGQPHKYGQSKHLIKQLKVSSALTFNNHRDYVFGDNSDIVATDNQKNTVDIREKKHEKKNVVTFALISSNRFLSKYGHVFDAKISVLEYQWKRVQIDGQPHKYVLQ